MKEETSVEQSIPLLVELRQEKQTDVLYEHCPPLSRTYVLNVAKKIDNSTSLLILDGSYHINILLKEK